MCPGLDECMLGFFCEWFVSYFVTTFYVEERLTGCCDTAVARKEGKTKCGARSQANCSSCCTLFAKVAYFKACRCGCVCLAMVMLLLATMYHSVERWKHNQCEIGLQAVILLS